MSRELLQRSLEAIASLRKQVDVANCEPTEALSIEKEIEAELAKPSGWRSIDTAPTGVSFYAADADGRYYLGSMIDGRFMDIMGNAPYITPTHWMPLPTPPAA
jgi:hypothetical protein